MSFGQPSFEHAAFAHQPGLAHDMAYDPAFGDTTWMNGPFDLSGLPAPQPMGMGAPPPGLDNLDFLDQLMAPPPPPPQQLESSVGPARVARRQAAHEQSARADPTRKPTPRGERPRKRDASATASQSMAASAPHASHAPAPTAGPSRRPPSPNATAGPSRRPASPAPESQDDAAPAAKPKKQRLTNLNRRDMCIWNRDHPADTQEDIARRFNVERSTVSKVLKEKHRWLEVAPDETVEIAKNRPPKFAEIEAKLQDWLVERMDAHATVSDAELRAKALEFAKGSNAAQAALFKASSGWLDNFKHRVGMNRGVFTGFGTNNARAIALAAGASAHPEPDPFAALGPTLMDNFIRDGHYDPQCDGADSMFTAPPRFKTSAKTLMERRGGRGWHELTDEEKAQSAANGDDDLYPPFALAAAESALENAALDEAEAECIAAEKAALEADEPYDFKHEFDIAVHRKLAAVDYATIDIPELDIPQAPHHPDEADLTPGPTGHRAHEAIWDVIRFALARKGRVFSDMHCALLLEMWARIMIVFERQRRAGERRGRYESIVLKDRSGKTPCGKEMVAEAERDVALNPTGEPTGEDVVAAQTRRENVEALRELQAGSDAFEADPHDRKWAAIVHDAETNEIPTLGKHFPIEVPDAEEDAPEVVEQPERAGSHDSMDDMYAPAVAAEPTPDLDMNTPSTATDSLRTPSVAVDSLNTPAYSINTPSFADAPLPLRREPGIHDPASSALAFEHGPGLSSAHAFIDGGDPGYGGGLYPQHDVGIGDPFSLSLDPGGECFDAVMHDASGS